MALPVHDTARRLGCTLEIIAVHVGLRSRTTAAFGSDTAAAIDREPATTAAGLAGAGLWRHVGPALTPALTAARRGLG